MRPLTEEESRTFYTKLSKYIGKHIKELIDRSDGDFCFRLHRNKVYYLRTELAHLAESFPRDQLVSMGTCFGKFTKTGKFTLQITCVDYLSQYADYKVWVKPSAEMSFLYGNHILKAGLGRITENTPAYQGVIVLSMNDIPLGFGVTGKSTEDCRKAEPTAIVCLHQADAGEFLRDEDSGALF